MNQFQLPSRRELFYGGGWHQAATQQKNIHIRYRPG
jgi:hypothetical protein